MEPLKTGSYKIDWAKMDQELQLSFQDLATHSKRIIEYNFSEPGYKAAMWLICLFKRHYWITKHSGDKYCYRCLKELKKPRELTPFEALLKKETGTPRINHKNGLIQIKRSENNGSANH